MLFQFFWNWGPPKTEPPASSIIWFPLGFGDTSKFWELLHLQWLGFVAGIPLRTSLEFVPDVPSTGFWGSQHPMWILGGSLLCLPRHSRTPLFLHQEAQNSAGPLLVYFVSRLFSWGSEPLRGGMSPGKEWRSGGGADHINSVTARITTGGTMNEDHICQARHKRRPRQSQTQTSRQRWGSGDHWPSVCKGFWEDEWNLHI